MSDFMYGVQIMVIGMSVVFVSLIGLTYLMELLHRLFNKEKKEKPDVQGPPPVAISQQHTEDISAPGGVPAEVMAVIAGSIAAYLDGAAAPIGAQFRIVRREIPLSSATWSMAGRQEHMNLRQMG